MQYVIYGAGGIGGVIGGRMHQAGLQVTLIARGEHGRALMAQGLKLVDHERSATLQVPTVLHPSDYDFASDTFANDTTVLMCMKSQHMQAALEDLAASAPTTIGVVCVQNGVANERLALRYFTNVYGSVVNLPAMYLTPGEVVSYAKGVGGILDTGCFPTGIDERARQINEDLTKAGFAATPDATVMRQKYAKLLLNLYNAMQVILTDPENGGDFARDMRKEASACFTVAGVDCATRDEIQERQEGVYEAVDVPGYDRPGGSTWQSVKRGTGDVETDFLNGEVCLLGRLHGVPTPVNDICVAMAREVVRKGQGPGLMSSTEFAAQLAKQVH